jgi:hypothetical protein
MLALRPRYLPVASTLEIQCIWHSHFPTSRFTCQEPPVARVAIVLVTKENEL